MAWLHRNQVFWNRTSCSLSNAITIWNLARQQVRALSSLKGVDADHRLINDSQVSLSEQNRFPVEIVISTDGAFEANKGHGVAAWCISFLRITMKIKTIIYFKLHRLLEVECWRWLKD